MDMLPVNEAKLYSRVEEQADRYFRKYKRYMENLEKYSLVSKVKPITAFDRWALGKMLENTDALIRMCEANGTVGDLGLIPRIARDVVTIAYGISPISIIASVQPQDEEVGIVYYKAVKAVTGGGNVSAGDTLADVFGNWKTPSRYTGAEQQETIGTGDGETVNFTGTLTTFPIRPGTVVITAGSVVGRDYEQDGNILGVGISGTVDYTTGDFAITFADAPEDETPIVATYWGNVEDMTLGVREINYELVSKVVRARIFALKGLTGLFKSFAMQKRFGVSAEEELATDLVNAVNSEILGEAITKLDAGKPGTVTWAVTTPPGVSYFEHKQSLKDAIAGAERRMIENAKRGAISFIIAGSGVCSVLRTLFGWETVYEGRGMATAHLYGNLDGIPVIRVTDTNVLDANQAIVGYKGPSAFEAPIVYAPYMPITVTSVLPTASPIVTQRAAATWAAVEVLVNNFTYGLAVSGTYPYS
jgi:hypothetical protein